MNRRTYLALVGTTGALTGCSAVLGSDEGGTVTPSPTESRCGANDLRWLDLDYGGHFDLEYESVRGFELTVEPERVEHGSDFTVRLRNTTDEPRSTGNRHSISIETERDGDWQPVYQIPEDFGWSTELVEHQAGEGFEWNLRASRPGLERDDYYVCHRIEPGTYRFVFFGLGSEGGDSEPVLAVRFEITGE